VTGKTGTGGHPIGSGHVGNEKDDEKRSSYGVVLKKRVGWKNVSVNDY
jgi:hypothetical protein